MKSTRAAIVAGYIKETLSEWMRHNAFRLSAALAYYTVFSLGPLLLLSVAVAGFFIGREAATGELTEQLGALLGPKGAEAVQSFLGGMKEPATNVLASIVGFAVLLFGAAGVFIELKASLNEIWGAHPKQTTGVMGLVKDRLLSFTMVLAIGFLLLVSLILSTVLAAASDTIARWIEMPPVFFHGVGFFGSFLVITLLFAMIFKVLPEANVQWRDVWVGAVTTSLLFTVGKTLIGFYLGRSSATSAYGASGSVVVVLLWAYYSSLILFLGAEFTQVFARRFGSQCPAETRRAAA